MTVTAVWADSLIIIFVEYSTCGNWSKGWLVGLGLESNCSWVWYSLHSSPVSILYISTTTEFYILGEDNESRIMALKQSSLIPALIVLAWFHFEHRLAICYGKSDSLT